MTEINDSEALTSEILDKYGFDKTYLGSDYWDWSSDYTAIWLKALPNGMMYPLSLKDKEGYYQTLESKVKTLGELKTHFLKATGTELTLKPVPMEDILDNIITSEIKKEEKNYYDNMHLWQYHLARLQQLLKEKSPAIQADVKVQAEKIIKALEETNPKPYVYADLNNNYTDNIKHFIGQFKALIN